MKKLIIAVLAIMLVVCISIGATLAYLFVETGAVKNTFEYGDIDIDLKEDTWNADGSLDASNPTNSNTYKYVPGDTLNKRPYVTVKATSQACYVFVQITESNNTYTGLDGKIINWTVDTSNWTKLDGTDDVWYMTIDSVTTTDTSYDVLANDQVTVNDKLTKVMINANDFTTPTINFVAYAVQKDNVADVAAAWAIAQNKGSDTTAAN